jgi:uridylate kinase
MPEPKFKRVLLKISGEALQGNSGIGMDFEVMDRIALEIKDLVAMGIEIAIVIGGGNFLEGSSCKRKRNGQGYCRLYRHACNGHECIGYAECFEQKGVFTRVQSAINMQEVAEPFIRRRSVRHLEKKRVVIFAAGTGNPYFSTDTAAALRALEINAEVIFKATKVDGVYDKDPNKYKDAVKFEELTYLEVIKRGLKSIRYNRYQSLHGQ